MNIGVLSSRPFPPRKGGLANYVYHTASRFAQKGHNVVVITRGSGGRIVRETVQIANSSVTVFKVPILPLYPFHVHIHGILVNTLLDRLRREFDVIHAHSPYVPAISPPPALVTTVHTLERVDNASFEGVSPRSLAYKASGYIFSSVEKKLLRGSTILTSVSGHVLDELRDVYGISRPGVVVGNGVDERVFVPDQTGRRDGYILYVGRMDYRKGLFDLLKCAKDVCERDSRATFVFAGEGPLAGPLAREATRMGIGNRIKFTGYVDPNRLVRLYQHADAFVAPSLYEGLPTVVLEAMSCGIPVVATRIGGNIDVISHERNGFLVPPKSPAEMARYILKLVADNSLRMGIGREARKTIEMTYTWDKVAEKLLRCLAVAAEMRAPDNRVHKTL